MVVPQSVVKLAQYHLYVKLSFMLLTYCVDKSLPATAVCCQAIHGKLLEWYSNSYFMDRQPAAYLCDRIEGGKSTLNTQVEVQASEVFHYTVEVPL